MTSRLTACLLARDEERTIERAIRSVALVADEVIVADTGSTDRTASLAEGLGARVVEVGWDDDFAEGRNAALAEASGDWILWLNPDEELLAPEPLRLKALLAAGEDAFGYLALVQDQAHADRPDQLGETWDLRLYRRRPDLRYVGRVHPSFDPELARVVLGEGFRVHPAQVVIRRHSYTSAIDERKLRWAVRLLERELADRPDRLPTLVEYGRNLLRLGDPKGHEVLAHAINQVVAGADEPGPPGPDAAILLEYVLRTPATAYRGALTPDRATALALRWFPDSPPLLWAIAESAFRAGRAGAAAVVLERLVQLGRTGTYARSIPFDPAILGPPALLNLGQCYQALGEPDKARRCYQELLPDPDFGPSAAACLAEIGALLKGRG